MKNFFTLTLCFLTLSLTAQEPLTYPFNPDANGDTFVGVSDVLEGISTYDNFFFPSEIMVGDTTLSNWIQILNQTLANQQAVIDSLQASLDSQDTQLDSTMIADMIAAAGGLGGGGCDFSFPEGIHGEPVYNIDLISNSYTVPAGKNLYILRFITNDGPVFIEINGTQSFYGNGEARFGENPIVAKSGDVVSGDTEVAISCNLSAILIDQDLDVEHIVNFDINSTSYTVPYGKKLYLMRARIASTSPSLYINGIYLKGLSGDDFFGEEPIIVKGGDEISIDGSDAPVYLNGYLVDEDYFADCGGGGGSSEGGSVSSLDSLTIVNMINDALSNSVSIGVGDYYGGGVVAYIFQPDDDGYFPGETHGYIINELVAAGTWGCLGVETGVNSGTGAENTAILAEQCPLSQGNGCPGGPSAAKYWNDLTWNGFSDWFLPSMHEATQLNPSLIPVQYFWIAEESINGECSYCTPENVALSWWPVYGEVDWFTKDAHCSSIGIREF